MTTEEFANSLTSPQYVKLIKVAFGPVPAEIDNMTDEELLHALQDGYYSQSELEA